jgi:multiple sugar transport system substrate-binding protein
MKKFTLYILLLSCVVLMLTGCTGEKKTGSQGGVELRWLTKVENDAEAAQWKELADDVTKKYPNIKVNFESTDWNGYWTKLPVEIASGNAPDLMYMHAMRTKDYLEDGFLPLNARISADSELNISDFYTGILEAYRINGETYGLPYDFGPYVIFYNRDLFDKYSVPYPDNDMTWDSFLDRCKKLSRDGNYGFATLPNIDNILPQLLCEGVEIINASGGLLFNNPEVAVALQKVTDLINVEKVAPVVTDTGNTVWHLEAFQAGNIGMVVDGPWTATRIKDYCDFKAGVCMMYKSKIRMTSINGSGFGISKTTKYPDEAYKALASISSTLAQKKLAEWGRALPSRASQRDAYYSSNSDILGLQKAVEDSCDPTVGIPYYSTRKFQEVYSVINQNLQGIFSGTAKASDATKAIQSMGEAILR